MILIHDRGEDQAGERGRGVAAHPLPPRQEALHRPQGGMGQAGHGIHAHAQFFLTKKYQADSRQICSNDYLILH